MSLFRKWLEKTYVVAGEAVKLKLRVLPAYGEETARILGEIEKWRDAAGKLAEGLEKGTETDLSGFLPPLGLLREALDKWVVPLDIVDEAGAKVEKLKAEDLPYGLACSILIDLKGATMLSAAVGKASSSPSTSPSPTAASSDSTAPSIAPEASA